MTGSKSHWERIYAANSPSDLSWYQSEPVISLQMVHNCGLQKQAPIIDVGGGTSELINRLLEEGYKNLAVLDISSTALSCAKNRLGDKASAIEWFETDVTEFDPPHPFLLWHDRALFHFLTQSTVRRKYVEVIKKSLMPGGYLILAAFAIGGPEKCSGLNVVQYDGQKLLSELGGDHFSLVEQLDEVHTTPTNIKQLFTYFRILRR